MNQMIRSNTFGKVEDILTGTGVNELEYAYGYTWSEDMRRVIILTGNRPDDQLTWFCDLDTNTLVRLDEVAFYAYDIPSDHMTKTLDHTPYYHYWDENPIGVMTYGSGCILVDQERQVQIINLRTGTRTDIEDFTFQTGDTFMPSPSGNKLLYYARGSKVSPLDGLGISQIGVVDLEKGTFIAFDREGYENLHEESIGWEDDNTVSIGARTQDDETRYLIMYQF